ncbi:MAG: ABC transporter ATP-binding protein [Acidobacteria bacterium]|nr:ABC transporter ATP-binding protein [Acidobacteriota bacterium]
MNILSFQDVHRAYKRGHDVLAGVSFTIQPGQVIGLIGKNGAGKTTLIRLAMGMIAAQRGQVRVFDLDPREHPVAVKRRVGYVAEDQILPPYLTIGEIVALHRALYPTWDEEAAAALAERFELPLGAKVRTLSRGQARRVALLCAVAHRPELLLLDEPASGLDPVARREFLETSIELLNEAGTTILFSSHYLTDVERLADRIVMLDAGRVLIDQALEELQEGFTLALIEQRPGLTREQLLALPACVAVRERAGVLRAVFHLDPRRAEREISDIAGAAGACRTIALEDMFVELVGGQP